MVHGTMWVGDHCELGAASAEPDLCVCSAWTVCCHHTYGRMCKVLHVENFEFCPCECVCILLPVL